MREALAEYFRVLSFTTVDADRNHFQSFVLEKPGRRFHNRRPLTLGVAKRHQQRRIAGKDVDGEARLEPSGNGRSPQQPRDAVTAA